MFLADIKTCRPDTLEDTEGVFTPLQTEEASCAPAFTGVVVKQNKTDASPTHIFKALVIQNTLGASSLVNKESGPARMHRTARPDSTAELGCGAQAVFSVCGVFYDARYGLTLTR